MYDGNLYLCNDSINEIIIAVVGVHCLVWPIVPGTLFIELDWAISAANPILPGSLKELGQMKRVMGKISTCTATSPPSLRMYILHV